MIRELTKLPLSYTVPCEGHTYHDASIAPAGPSDRDTPPRRSPKPPTSRVRLRYDRVVALNLPPASSTIQS
jgi:hypothetical protein